MNTITAIKPSSRDPMVCIVKVGREVVARLSMSAVERLGLSVGMTWEEPIIGQVRAAATVDAARKDAIKLLRRRTIGSDELVDRLKRKGHAEPAARAVVDDLLAKHVLDDERYGRAVLESELHRKPTGRRLLQQKLFRKRLPRELSDRLVRQAVEATDMTAGARKLAEKKLRSATLQRCDPATRKRRLWGTLARRGFDAGTIEAALAGLPGLDEGTEG